MPRTPFLALAALALLAPAARAELRFTQAAIDAGEVRRGPALVQRFPFVNVGPRAVEVCDVKASCGCLRPRFSKQHVGPGEEAWVELEINTLSQPAGPNSWRIQLLYRDGDQDAEAVVQLSARLVSEIDVQPAALNLVCADRPLGHTITVTDLRAQPLAITAVDASSPHLRVQLQEPKRDAGGRLVHVVHVEVAADYPEGRHEEVVGMYTDDPAYRELKVPVTVQKRGRQRLATVPERVTFEGRPGEALPSRIVLVRDAENEPVIVDQVTADDPALVCRWAQGPNTMATIKVQVDAAKLAGRDRVQGTLHVQVRHPGPQTLAVPVEVSIK